MQAEQADIFDSIQTGDVPVVKSYLDAGTPVNLTDKKGWSLLHHAAACGQVEVIRLLQENGCYVDAVDNNRRTPLHYATGSGSVECVRILIEMGSDVNALDNERTTPLQWAVMCEQYSVMELLVEHGGTVEVDDTVASSTSVGVSSKVVNSSEQIGLKASNTPGSEISKVENNFGENIFKAAQSGDIASVKAYLDLGVPVDLTDEDSWSPVHHAIAHGQVEVIRLLMDRGCRMFPVKSRTRAFHCTDSESNIDTNMDNIIFNAARNGDTTRLDKCLLDLGIPIDVTDEDGRTPLHCAAGEGQVDAVKLLIDKGCCIDPVDHNGWTPSIYATMQGQDEVERLLNLAKSVCDSTGWTPLHAAAADGQLEVIKMLLSVGGRKLMTVVAGKAGTPLHQAAGHGHKDVVTLLLNEGCPVDIRDSDGITALHLAAQYGRIDNIDLLVTRGLDVNVVDNEGCTPLHFAATYGQLESVRALLRLGGRRSMSAISYETGSPLHQAAAGGYKDIVTLLLSEGCPIGIRDNYGFSALHAAAHFGRVRVIEILVTHGLDVNVVDKEGNTPLHTAVGRGQLEAIRALVRLGGRRSLTVVAVEGGTPLHLAVKKGLHVIVSLLLHEGCPVDVRCRDGFTALHLAAQCGQVAIIEMLVYHGLDVNVEDNEGSTPLHSAAAHGQLKSVQTLLQLGGRKSLTKVAGNSGTPLHQAVGGGHKDVITLLLNEGCPVDISCRDGCTALHLAAQCGEVGIIEVLVERGLDVNVLDNKGCTPLHCAAYAGQLESVRMLLRSGGSKSMTISAGISGTPLHQATEDGHTDIVCLLLHEGCPVHVAASNGATALHVAAMFNRVNIIKIFVNFGLDVTTPDSGGLTPLHWAVCHRQLESVQTLARLGGSRLMTAVAEKSGTPLYVAIAEGYKDVVLLLLHEGCPVNVNFNNGLTGLHLAAQFGRADIMETLITLGLDVNVEDDKGRTPLHFAVCNHHLESVRTLIRLGGKRSMTVVADEEGTPLHQAVVGGDNTILLLLLNEGCPINVVSKEGSTLLHTAARYGQVKFIETFMKLGLEVSLTDNKNRTPLHTAARYGHLESVNILLTFGRKTLTMTADKAGTPLHQAAAGGNKHIVSTLLHAGCPVDVKDCIGSTALHFAAQHGQVDVIEMLVGCGLDVNVVGNDGSTPLHSAAYHGQLESVRTLLTLGGRKAMTMVAAQNGTPAHYAIAEGQDDVVKHFLEEGCPTNITDSQGRSLLHYAAAFGQVSSIEMLVKLGIDVNIVDNERNTPLHSAAVRGHLESVQLLVRLGGHPSMFTKGSNTGMPLHQAASAGQKDIVTFFLNVGLPVDIATDSGYTALHFAAQSGHVDIIEMLVNRGSDVNTVDNDGLTAMHAAAITGQLDSIRTLLRLGGTRSMSMTVGLGGTPLHQAVGRGNRDIVNYLVEKGCPISLTSDNGSSVLHFASHYGHVDIIDMFSKKGVAVNAVDNSGMTPLHTAVEHNMLKSLHKLRMIGGENLRDIFGLNLYDYIFIFQNDVAKIKEFCGICDAECKSDDVLDVVSTLANKSDLDIDRILCLAAVGGNVEILDAMVQSRYPLNTQRMPHVLQFLSYKHGYEIKTLLESLCFDREPLNPLHLSLLVHKLSGQLHGAHMRYAGKLISHPHTKYTIYELFPNGLSPLDVARQFGLHDIAGMIERAGGRPGMWADLPKEIGQKSIELLTMLKELKVSNSELGGDHISPLLSMLGSCVVKSNEFDSFNKYILAQKPKISHLQPCILSQIKVTSKWKIIGEVLEMDHTILDKLGERASDVGEAYYSMLKYWLEHGRNVTWKTLLDAIGHFETKKSMDDIRKKIEEICPKPVPTEVSSSTLLGSSHNITGEVVPRRQVVLKLDTRNEEATFKQIPSIQGNPTLTEANLWNLVGRKMYSRWKEFAVHLHVETRTTDVVYKQCLAIVEDCFKEMTRQWLHGADGTGDLPRTWETVFKALRLTGFPLLAKDVEGLLSLE